MAEKFIARAIKRPGAMTKRAKAAGMSPMGFAHEHMHAEGLAGQQSRFAMLLARLRPNRKGKTIAKAA